MPIDGMEHLYTNKHVCSELVSYSLHVISPIYPSYFAYCTAVRTNTGINDFTPFEHYNRNNQQRGRIRNTYGYLDGAQNDTSGSGLQYAKAVKERVGT